MNDEHGARPAQGSNQEMRGQALALEMMVTQLAWEWAMSQPHPPTALSQWMRPIEEAIDAMTADTGNDQCAMQSARETVKGVFRLLEERLHVESLRRAKPKGADH